MKNAPQNTTPPYDRLALIYDRVMSHVNYKTWGRYIRSLMAFYPNRLQRVADISCGTGSILPFLSTKNCQLFASDRSLAMLCQAGKKKVPARLVCSDFLQLPFREASFDVVICLYDSVNYILEEDRINLFFRSVKHSLKYEGLFIFDAVTPYVCRTAFRNYEERENWNSGSGYRRRSWYDEKQAIQHNEFEIHLDGRVYIERHRQKIRPISEWLDHIRLSGLRIEHVFGNFSMRRLKKKSERAHIVCRKID